MTSNPASVGAAKAWLDGFAGPKADALRAYIEKLEQRAPHPDREAEPTDDDDVRAALDLALVILGEAEPGDSRAVSNEYVAMASAGTPHHNDAARKIIRDRLQVLSVSPPASKCVLAACDQPGCTDEGHYAPVVQGSLRASPCVPTEGHEAAVVAVEYRVSLPWRKAGCEGWRVFEAERRFLAGEYSSLEVRYSDGSAVHHAADGDDDEDGPGSAGSGQLSEVL